jgi:hypothetical protein
VHSRALAVEEEEADMPNRVLAVEEEEADVHVRQSGGGGRGGRCACVVERLW